MLYLSQLYVCGSSLLLASVLLALSCLQFRLASDAISMAAPISKQERIRLNQQRSRARRQEYLQSLEKRVNECHNTHREAELRLESYQQLRKENQFLRALLNDSGWTTAQIDSRVQNNLSGPSLERSSSRNLRPKIWADSAPSQTPHLTPLDNTDNHNVSRASYPMPPTTESNIPTSCCNSICPLLSFGFEDPPAISNTTLEFPQPQVCETLGTYVDPTLQGTSENFIIYSSELDLIDSYNASCQDIERHQSRTRCGI